MKRVAAVLLVFVLGACTGSDAPAHRPGAQPVAVSLFGRTITLVEGDARALRIGFDAAAPSAHLIVTFTPSSARVAVCALDSVDAALPSLSTCRRDVGSGVREPITASKLGGVAVVLMGGGEASADIVLEFDEASGGIGLRLPLVRAPAGASACKDNGCNPIFELAPGNGGPFAARATWSGPAATLVLLQGRIRGRSETATGIPYGEAARADGTSPLDISTRLGSPGEYALALRATSAGDARDVAIEARWP